MTILELVAKITGDTSGLDRALDDASSKTESFGSKLSSGLGTAAKIGGAALAAAGSAAVAISKQAIDAYADYEQLEGGIETLFGDSAQQVMNDASEAFKTAGMSMNEYMETSIQSAASLINSLGGDQAKAAELMNMSITDMADNVNKMGTSMEGVQNAYRGFSRGNFTMLDNLALGFAGTKEGMQELLDKAQEFSGIEYNIDSYADIVEAIHVVQTEMGITGTTAKEASETISGSLASLKSAWSNLLTGMANDGADLDQLIEDVLTSAETAFSNILPVAERALGGLSELIAKIAPVIVEELPGLIDTVLPPLLEAASSIVGGLMEALPAIWETAVPALLNAASQLIQTLVDTFGDGETLQGLVDAAVTTVEQFGQFLIDNAPLLMKAAIDLILALAEGLFDPENISTLVDTAIELITVLTDSLIENLPILIERVPEIIIGIVEAIVENLPKIAQAAWDIITKLTSSLVEKFPEIIEKGKMIVLKIAEGITAIRDKMREKANDLIEKIKDGVKEKFEDLKTKGKEIVDKVKEGLDTVIQNAKNWGRDLIQNFIDGLLEKWETLKSNIAGVAEGIKDFLGFSEPKKGPLSDFHTYAPDMMDLFAKGIKENKYKILDELSGLTTSISGGFQSKLDSRGIGYNDQPLHITIQSVLDGKVISEAVTKWQRNKSLATGGI